MAFSAGQSYAISTAFDPLNQSFRATKPQTAPFFPKKIASRKYDQKANNVMSKKPLCISAVSGFGRIIEPKDSKTRDPLSQCNAYEASRTQSIPIGIELDREAQAETAQKMKIGVYFATWWALNVVFNIYNKKVLNAFPFPWLTSTLSLAAGSLMMLVSWATRVAETPKTDLHFWKALFPVSIQRLFDDFLIIFCPKRQNSLVPSVYTRIPHDSKWMDKL